MTGLISNNPLQLKEKGTFLLTAKIKSDRIPLGAPWGRTGEAGREVGAKRGTGSGGLGASRHNVRYV